jgi:2-(1,2-epoxy-1,2-dihydrophenyl)acetyl-CoA isomerase
LPSDTLQVERQDRVAVLTLNRPDSLNAISRELHLAIMEAIAEIDGDDDIWAAIITGSGRAFCAGVDLSAMRAGGGGERQVTQNERLDQLMWWGRQTLALHALDKPLIAAVNGVAAGLGMSIALACDLRVGSTKARFRTVMVERSMCPDSGMSWFLPRIVGYSRAADLICTSRQVEADEAYRLGLLDREPAEDVLAAAFELAGEMTRWPPLAVRTSKRLAQQSLQSSLEDQLVREGNGLRRAGSGPNDAAEAMAAFVEKRAPKFTGT